MQSLFVRRHFLSGVQMKKLYNYLALLKMGEKLTLIISGVSGEVVSDEVPVLLATQQ